MKESAIRALFFWILIIMIIQPFLSYRDYLLETIVKSNTFLIAQKAAVDGTVTQDLKREILDNFNAVGLSDQQVQIDFDTITKERGQRLDVTILADRAPSLLYHFGTYSESRKYFAHSYVMSERVE